MTQSAITRSCDIHYAHRVPLHGGKCAKLHGHRATIEMTLVGTLQEEGAATDMVLDFADLEQAMLDLKAVLCHRTILHTSDPFLLAYTGAAQGMLAGMQELYHVLETEFATFVLLPYAPTAERLAEFCYVILSNRLNNMNQRVRSVTFWETSKSRAQFPASPVC